MAKNKAQVLTLLQEAKDLLDTLRTFFAGNFLTAYRALSTAIAAGDDEPEDEAQVAALEAVMASAIQCYTDAQALCFELHPTLGRYAGSADLGDTNLNIQAFSDKLDGDSEAVKSRGFTKFSTWTAGGSNVGDGHFVVRNTDRQGELLDYSHIETLTLLCIQDAVTGNRQVGKEQFVARGAAPSDYPWEEGGSGRENSTQSYNPPFGITQETFGVDLNQRSPRTGDAIDAVGASQNAGNLLPNGNCAAGLTGSGATQSLASWIGVSGGAGLDLETTNQLKGVQSLKATTNFEMYYPISRDTVNSGQGADDGCPYAVQVWARCNSSLTDGDITLKVEDDSTVHGTVTIALDSLTDDTWTGGTPVIFIMPSAPGANLRATLELTDIAGSGAEVLVDNIMCVPLAHVDGRIFGVIEGQTNWRVGDTATGQTTISEAGALQRMFNECFGRIGFVPYVRADASAATYWADS